MCEFFTQFFTFEAMVSPDVVCFVAGAEWWMSSLKTGSRSFRLIAIRKLQFGSRCFEFVRDIAMIGCDVWGESMLGSSGRCSLAV